MTVVLVLVSLVVVLYSTALLLYLWRFIRMDEARFQWTGHLIEIGFLIHTLAIFAETFASEVNPFHLPVATVGEASAFFAWSLAFIYLILVRQLKTETFALILTPILILFLMPFFYPFEPNVRALQYFNNVYFIVHILSAFFGYACFALSFIAAALYLILDKSLKRKVDVNFYKQFPSLEDLENFIFRANFSGVILLGVGIITGALWAKSAFGSFLIKEPKYFASLLTLGAYLVIIYVHSVCQIKGRRLVLMSLSAFVLVLLTFWGTSFFEAGYHAGIR